MYLCRYETSLETASFRHVTQLKSLVIKNKAGRLGGGSSLKYLTVQNEDMGLITRTY